MMDNILFGLSFSVACLLMYKVKSRRYRKWLGILLGTVGVVLTFTVRPEPDRFSPFTLSLMMWIVGLTLFCERGKYEDDD